MRILVVDDNRELAENLGEILEEAGHVPVVVDHPAGALAATEAQRFDLILLDVRLPGMDGVELFQRLRRTAPDAHYLLMTAFTEAGRLRDARRAGIEGILPKPVPVEALLGFVDAADRGANGMLIVEDEEGLATNLEELFAGQWEVRRARSLAEALDVCDRQPLAAALVDLRLPDGSGEELVQQLLARGTRVVVITGMPREDAEALVGGMVPLVTKPFDAPDLIERLRATA